MLSKYDVILSFITATKKTIKQLEQPGEGGQTRYQERNGKDYMIHYAIKMNPQTVPRKKKQRKLLQYTDLISITQMRTKTKEEVTHTENADG